MVMDKSVKTHPVGIKNNEGEEKKLSINVISLVQIVEKEMENVKKEPIKTVVTNSAKIQGISSQDLDLGVIIKVENGGKPEKGKRAERQ